MNLTRLTPATLSPWLAIAYAIHLCDERMVGDGVAEWATRVAGMAFSNVEWLVVNAISLAVVVGLAWAIHAEKLGATALLVLGGHVFMHATQHLAGAVRFDEFSPGIVTGILICLPLSLLAIWTGFRLIPWPRAAAGLFAGFVTFQPIWHRLLLVLESSSSHAV